LGLFCFIYKNVLYLHHYKQINLKSMIQIKRQLITPSIAKSLLEANKRNRRISQPSVHRYTYDMINDRWKEDTVEPIKISKSGVILDGQHRLLAVIASGKSIFFHIAYELDDSVTAYLDTGKSRNATDVFKIEGVLNDSSIPSTISFFNYLSLSRKAGVQKNHKATNAMLLEQYYENAEFWQDVVRRSHRWYTSFAKILPKSCVGGFYAHFHSINKVQAELFMEELCMGFDITNNVINLLRNKLMQDKVSPRKMPATLKYAIIIKTWNVWITNQKVKILKYDTINEPFPIAKSA
jgi:hypothetical protein